MKWILLAGFIAFGCYWLNFLKTDKRAVYFSGLLMGFLPFILTWLHLLCAPYSFAGWAGYCKGWEITIIDAVAAAVLFSGKFRPQKTPMMWPIIFYIAAVAVAVPLAPYFMISIAYFFQLVRMLMVFLAVARLATREDGAKGVFYGLVSGLTLQCFFAMSDRVHGVLQTGGTFGHQNLLGFVTHTVLLPSFCLLMAGRWTRMAALGVASAAIVVVLTASRATIMVAGIGIVISYIAASSSNWNSRKGTFGLITIGMLIVAAPFAQESLGRRFTTNGGKMFNEDVERTAFENAAKMMIHDHPLGVGPNHYILVANVDKYSEKAKVIAVAGSRGTNVHNGYLLVNAETGYQGLIAYVGMLGTMIFTCLYYGRKYRRQGYSELIVGVGCTMIAIVIHNKFEWMFVTYQAQYLIFTVVGLAAGCIVHSQRILGQQKRRRREKAAEMDAIDHGPMPQPAT